jgi:flavodoxin
MKTLVVFYSRTGNTRRLARAIAGALNAEIEEIADQANRRGLFGYLRSGNEGWFGRRAEIRPVRHDPRAFDVVIVGTPIWRVSVSSPVRTYVQDHATEMRNVAFFCTFGSFGSRYVFGEMEELCGKPPLATLACREREIASPDLASAVDAFAGRLRISAASAQARITEDSDRPV